MELLDRTKLIKKLLVDQPWHLQELVVGDKLIHDLSLHSSGLKKEKGQRVLNVTNGSEFTFSN